MSVDGALWCVVPAAGRGSRFGADIPKQYVSIAGKPLLRWTLERLAAHSHIAGLVVVLSADEALWPDLRGLSGKPVFTAIGGGERADSVLAGLNALGADIADDAFVLVHDAARPCVREGDITRLIELAGATDGGLLATPLRDTLKRADDDQRVVATQSRESCWRALTPQMFRRGELVDALMQARSDGVAVTDEAMAMERCGHRPLLVEGSDDNIKVTTPGDLAWVRFLLDQGRGVRD